MNENYVLDAVDALTSPIRSKVLQPDPTAGALATRTVKVVLPPLLVQLDDAIRSSMGKSTTGASLASERNTLDADALYRFFLISNTVRDWARLAEATIHEHPVDTLRAWYVTYSRNPTTPEQDRFYTKKMRSWEAQITTKLAPKRVWDLPNPCPECHAQSWFNPADGNEYLRPLIVEYGEPGPNLIQEATAKCRACGAQWGVRELAYTLEQNPEAA